jgi:ATP-dependent Lhr-like helicase
VWLPQDEPQQTAAARAVAGKLASLQLLIAEINGARAADHPLARHLERAGFTMSPMGFQVRRAGG